MTKKENEAIELLKQPPEMPFIYCERENAIGIVLKLVEKQQKEIEDLKIKNKKIQEINYRVNKNLLELAETSISKDKIREKIKEYEMRLKNMNSKTTGSNKNWVNKSNVDFGIYVLEELLEE